MTIQHINKNAILSQILEKFFSQTEKGIKKYGHTVDPNDYSAVEWIDHAIEEHVDSIVYLTCLKTKLLEGNQ